jgi:uncharacterized UPF0160 family protein
MYDYDSMFIGIDPAKESDSVEEIYDRVYAKFVRLIDTVDYGIPGATSL